MRSEFEKDLAKLINKHGLEKEYGDIPDFILARFVVNILAVFGESLRDRDAFWGIDVKRDTTIKWMKRK